MLHTAILCRTLGRVCGIAEYAIHLQKRLPGSYLARSSDDIQPNTDVVFIQFEAGLYPGGPADILNEIYEIRFRIPRCFIVIDYHSLYRMLSELRWHAIVAIKRGWSPIPGVLQLPHLVNQPAEDIPPPKEIRLGAFGFAVPFKHYEDIIALADRLKVPLTLIASIPSPNDWVYQMCAVYAYKLGQRAHRSKYTNYISEFLPAEDVVRELQQCSHLISAQEDVHGEDGGPSGSMRVMLGAKRPLISVDNGRARDVGAICVPSLQDITLDFLKQHREVTGCPDGIEWYENLMHWFEVAKGVEQPILHVDEIYNVSNQFERVEWIRPRIQGRAVDVGIGNGWTTNFFRCEAGVDNWPERVRYASIRFPHIRFYEMDASKEAMPGFETAVMAEIIEHMPYEYARHMLQIWADTGVNQILLTTPNAGKPNYDHGCVHNPEHVWFPTMDTVKDIVPEGFSAELTTTTDADFILGDLRRG